MLTMLIAMVILSTGAHLKAENAATEMLEQFCADCHGPREETPEGGFSLSAAMQQADLSQSGDSLKRALDAIEGYEMPPRDAELPTASQRITMARSIRQRLADSNREGKFDPGRPVLRRLTRLEYNNTVRDLLGLETDVFILSERLPFDRAHYRPDLGTLPDRFEMGAREYGAKYPVLLRDSSLPGDSRAEQGFTNRGDAQSLSAVLLEQYIRLAGEIAFHPELLSRGERMVELFPQAKFRQLSAGKTKKKNPLATAEGSVAGNNNVVRTATGSAHELQAFRRLVQTAFEADRGGTLAGESLRNVAIAGKGGLIRVAYGKNAQRVLAINPNEDLWFAPFATAQESSGDTLMANQKKQLRKYELTFQSGGSNRFPGLAEVGIVLLSRNGESGLVKLIATMDDDSKQEVKIRLRMGAGVDNVFTGFSAPPDRSIRRLAIDGSEFSGDYVLADDLAFVTREPEILQPLIQAEPAAEESAADAPRTARRVDASLGKRSARERIAHLLRRAFRRKIEDAEVDTYDAIYRREVEAGEKDELGMRACLQAILASPSFLYVSSGGDTSTTPDAQVGSTVPLSGEELACRLSYFLWSSMPDDQLFHLARQGSLGRTEVLESEVRRMLKDPRSIELSENFYVQWLKLAELWSAQPDPKKFNDFYSAINNKRTLARDMFADSLLSFQALLIEDRPISDLLAPKDGFLNGKLADYHRLTSLASSSVENAGSDLLAFGEVPLRTYRQGKTIRREEMDDDRQWFRVRPFDNRRQGIVTSPAVLTLTSFPHRTSSIRRGVWILDTLFNRHPPAPKVAVAEIDEQEGAASQSLREQVERHRKDPACAACHDRIDPPGFALENFDAIGRWRNTDRGIPIDASGDLPGLGAFADAREFASLLSEHEQRFVQGFAEHLLSYALSRKLEYYDTPTVEQILERSRKDAYSLSSLIVAVVQSDAFRNRRTGL